MTHMPTPRIRPPGGEMNKNKQVVIVSDFSKVEERAIEALVVLLDSSDQQMKLQAASKLLDHIKS